LDIKELIQTNGKNFNRHPWELSRVKMLDFFIHQCSKNKTIVDIGSGDAFLAAAIADKYKSSTVAAIDINYTDDLISQLKKNYPANLQLLNSIIQLNSNGKTDIVILMDVLEHVEEPAILLQQILHHPSVSSETIFIITVPAYPSLFSQHDIFLGHYRRYTLHTLKKLLNPMSLKLRFGGYCFNSLVLVRILQILKEKIFGHKAGTLDGIHNWRSGNLITTFLVSLFWIEFKISWYLARIGLKIPGLTCYAVCRLSH